MTSEAATSEGIPQTAAAISASIPSLERMASDLSLGSDASRSANGAAESSAVKKPLSSPDEAVSDAVKGGAASPPPSSSATPPVPSLPTQATGGPPSRPSYQATGGPQVATGGPSPRMGGRGGPPSNLGSMANVNERARQMATARLPPSLQAKLAANANRSASGSPGQQPFGGKLGHDQRLDAATLLAGGHGVPAPSMGPAPTPGGPGLASARAPGGGMAGGFAGLGGRPGVGPIAGTGGPVGAATGGPGMRLPVGGPSLGLGGRGGPAGPPGGGLAGRRPKPSFKLSDIGIDTSPAPSNGPVSQQPGRPGGGRAAPPGRLAGASGGLMSNAFSNFSSVVDPSGRLNFAGKAVLSASGVEFSSGTSFKINMEDLELLDELGKGNYGTVRMVRHTRTKVEMAMKEIRLELDESKLNAIIMELDILHRATAPQIVEFYGAFFIESCVYYCMEFMDGGSLENLYDGPCSVPEDVLARVVSCMVRGLRFLKDELQIMHRDVKPTNVLVNRKGEVKLCDFGVSGQLEKSLAKTNIGCQSYMAPERIKGETQNLVSTYTVASDVWSLGLSIVETTMGTYPYPPETYSNVFAQLQAIVHGDPPQLPDAYSDVARDFVAGCLEKVPERRSTYKQMLEHPFLTADAERGDTVDMKGWVKKALEARDRRRKRIMEENVPGTKAQAPTSDSAAAR